METKEERKLSRNSINFFVLRFDLAPSDDINFDIIISDIVKHFDRTEKRAQTNFEVKFTTDNSEVNRTESFDFVLTKEKERYSMTFSKSQNAFWFDTTNYIDRNTYSNIISELIESILKHEIKMTIKRIGMRFINNFSCQNPKQIAKIFKQEIAKYLVQRISQDNISRLICQDEFNFDICKARVQYGVPNKFYPAKMNNYDLLLDIDTYDDKIQELNNINETIENLNHCAYNLFKSNINPLHIESLR